MFTGHYSVSFAGRAAEKRIPLWLLFIDVLRSIFVLLGIEKAQRNISLASLRLTMN
ncbi:MAG TPA: hypothetical protein VGP89_06155 [Candidatus Angelobacter sp.]|nr:hypothetical protein [Candidatus Angelobacter sp.]